MSSSSGDHSKKRKTLGDGADGGGEDGSAQQMMSMLKLLLDQNRRMEGKIDGMEGKIDGMEGKMDSMKGDIISLREKCDTLERSMQATPKNANSEVVRDDTNINFQDEMISRLMMLRGNKSIMGCC